MTELTASQKSAITTLDRPLVVVAGAGSGKTSVLVSRYLHLLKRGVSPRSILCLTFTNEAAGEMKERLVNRLTNEERAVENITTSVAHSPWISTLHGFCYRLLSEFGAALNLPEIRGVVEPFEFASSFQEAFQTWQRGLDETQWRWLLERFSRHELLPLVRGLHAKRHATSAKGEDSERLVALAAPLFHSLDCRFRQKGIYSFDELEHFTQVLLESASEVREALRTRFMHVFVDEFQDTSRAQWNILLSLVAAEPKKLFAVGDPRQSIYGFRGADLAVYFEACRWVKAEGGTEIALEENFRTEPRLLTAINTMSELVFEGSELHYSPMPSGRREREEIATWASVIRFLAVRGETVQKEREASVAEVSRLIALGSRPDSIALLFRVGDRLADYHAALSAAGIPARADRVRGLFDGYETCDLAVYLKALFNPFDDFAFAAFLRTPYVDLTYQQMATLSSLPGATLFEKSLCSALPRLQWFYSLVESGTFHADDALQALVRETKGFPKRADSILALLGPLLQGRPTLYTAVKRLEAWRREEMKYTERTLAEENSVSLLTIHAAKGLEFKHVILVDTLRLPPRQGALIRWEDNKPIFRMRHDGEPVESAEYERLAELAAVREREESKRLLYVALTRAKETLSAVLPSDMKLIPKNSWGELIQKAFKD